MLVDVYAALELDMDPATVGAVADEVPGVGVDDVERAVLSAYEVAEAPLEAATLALARCLSRSTASERQLRLGRAGVGIAPRRRVRVCHLAVQSRA